MFIAVVFALSYGCLLFMALLVKFGPASGDGKLCGKSEQRTALVEAEAGDTEAAQRREMMFAAPGAERVQRLSLGFAGLCILTAGQPS